MVPEPPSPQQLSRLAEAVTAVAPSNALGFVRNVSNGLLSLTYRYSYGCGEFVVPIDEVPSDLRPAAEGVRQIEATSIASVLVGRAEWALLFGTAQRVVSIPVARSVDVARVWIALSDEKPL